MKLFASTQFAGHYPVGVSAIVMASNREDAAKMLEDVLKIEEGLPQKIDVKMLTEIPMDRPFVQILNNGDY